MKSEEDARGSLSLDLGLADPSEGVDAAERRGKRSPETGMEFEFASGREEFMAEVEVEAENTDVFALGIPKQKEKQRLAAMKMKNEWKRSRESQADRSNRLVPVGV